MMKKRMMSALKICSAIVMMLALTVAARADVVNMGYFNGIYSELSDSGNLMISSYNFPDEAFRNFVSQYDTDGGGTLSHAEVDAVTSMDITGYGVQYSFGVEYFTSLEEFICHDASLEKLFIDNLLSLKRLDLSGCTSLTDLYCRQDGLLELDVSGLTALDSLECNGNEITRLDLSDTPALRWLNCAENVLSVLDVSGHPALESLQCYDNALTSLDVSGLTALTYLECHGNELTELDLSGLTSLDSLYCNKNGLTVLDVSENAALESLDCSENDLTSLDLSGNTALKYLRCSDNFISEIKMPVTSALESLYCSNNSLSELDLSECPVLRRLECGYNYLTQLDLSLNPALESLDCSCNYLTSLDVSGCPELMRVQAGPQYCSREVMLRRSGDAHTLDLAALIGEDAASDIVHVVCENSVTEESYDVTYDWETCIAAISGIDEDDISEIRLTYYIKVRGFDNIMDVTVGFVGIEDPTLPGDADGDGKITNSDALLIFRYIFNPEKYPLNAAALDTDGDGELTNADALKVFRNIFNPGKYPL